MEETVSSRSIAIKYGLILGVTLIIYSFFMQFAGLVGNQLAGNLSFLFHIIATILTFREYKSENNGFMSFGKGFGMGMFMLFVAAVLSNLFSYVYLNFIDDSMIQMVREITHEQMVTQNPNMTDEQVAQAMGFTNKFMLNSTMLPVMGFIMTMIFGLIISLIVSLIMKKDDPDAI
ncbi:DUF4199 domain-containing protein [Flexithrix dorotheae]|uniref:DUF4199 domain-containing protein n=1 Tax=Flexithrix dorotheae TaxID=70993 RepID=UPI000374543C|nr:DUF4199 domain-containing protein [Flexithrix dorotheae]